MYLPINSSEQNLTYTAGATDTLTFWDLPLWIQLSCIGELLIALFTSIKITPMILGKLSTIHKNKRAKKVEKYVADHPGCTMTQISAETDIQRDTVKYYVYQFITMGKLSLERAEDTRCYTKSRLNMMCSKKPLFLIFMMI